MPFWALQGDILSQAHAWVGQLLPTVDSLDPQARAELLWAAAVTAREMGDDAAALAGRERLAPLLEDIQDSYLRAVCELAVAWASAIVGDLQGVLRHASASLTGLEGQAEPFWTAIAASTIGVTETVDGHYDDALRHLTEMRELAERIDNPELIASARVQLGNLAVLQGRPEHVFPFDAPDLLDANGCRFRWQDGHVEVDAAVRPGGVVVRDVLDQYVFEVAAVPNQHPVEAFGAHGCGSSIRRRRSPSAPAVGSWLRRCRPRRTQRRRRR
jgi:hypothetical protein